MSYKPALYFPRGVYKLIDTLTIQQDVNNIADGFSIVGDGYHSVLYQTGANKNVLSFIRYKGVAASTWLQGITLKDISLIGAASTGTGLYLEGVLRSYFSNIVICTAGKGLHIKGGILNEFSGIRISKNLLVESPVSGVSPGIPTYGLYTEKMISDPDIMEVTTCNFSSLVVEGTSSDGVYLIGGYDNRIQGCVENCGGRGVYSEDDHNEFFMYMEGNTGDDFCFNTAYNNVVTVSAPGGTLVLASSADNIFQNCKFNTGSVPISNYDNTFIGCTFLTSFTDASYQASSTYISHRVAAATVVNHFGRALT